MPKEREPISTRLRSRDKNSSRMLPVKYIPKDNKNNAKKDQVISSPRTAASEERIPFSPVIDPNIYMDELLQLPVSFVRGSKEEQDQFTKSECTLISQSFTRDNKSYLQTSTFYQARVSAPVPSKRTRHLEKVPSAELLSREIAAKKSLPNDDLAILPYLPSAMKKSRKASLSSILSSPSNTPTPGVIETPLAIPKAKDTNNVSSSHVSDTPRITTLSPSRSAKKPTAAKPRPSEPASAPTVITVPLSSQETPTKQTSSPTIANQQIPPQSQSSTAAIGSTSTTVLDNEATTVPLPLCKTLPVTIKMDLKDKEKEYLRRQRRTFVHSRHLSHEESVQLAKTVYSNLIIGPGHRTVTALQGNISNWRTKLKKIFNVLGSKKFGLSQKHVANIHKKQLYNDTAAKMDVNALKSIWDHWIADPYVNTELFYADSSKESIDILRYVTVQLMIIYFKEKYGIYTAKKARLKMKKLDDISRRIELPDPCQ